MSIRWHSVTLTGEGPVFLADHVWPRTAKFGKITHVSMGVFVGSHARPHSKRRGPSILTGFGIYICPCGDTHQPSFTWWSNRWHSVFRGPHAPTLVNIFVTPLLTRDLYAVANLLISHFTQHSIVIFCTTCYHRFQKEKPPLNVMCKAEIYRYYWCYDYETNSLKTWHNWRKRENRLCVRIRLGSRPGMSKS